jgi:RHS repeat-associated protein
VFAPFTTTAKEEILSPFPLCCADPALASCMVNLEKPHQGVAGKNPALHQGITWSNSTTALGLRGARLETRVRSRCTGKERDSESGLDNFDFRYYASTMGRFMKPDDPFNWNESNPQSLNLYGYVGNNPLNRVDPDGHDCIYIDNDSGKMTGFSRGDCDNSTEEKANSGVYVNGTVDVINENSQDQVTGYGATGDAGTAVVGAITPPGSGLVQQASDSWQNFKTDWQLRIDANRPPPQKPSNLDALQYINNIMMGLVPLSPSRGSTGRTGPRDLKEQLAMEQVQANPGAGKKLPLQMNDPRWPASDGWVKMSQNVNGVEVHYVENTTTGQVDDFKFK